MKKISMSWKVESLICISSLVVNVTNAWIVSKLASLGVSGLSTTADKVSRKKKKRNFLSICIRFGQDSQWTSSGSVLAKINSHSTNCQSIINWVNKYFSEISSSSSISQAFQVSYHSSRACKLMRVESICTSLFLSNT